MTLNADSVGGRVLGRGDGGRSPVSERSHVSRGPSAKLQRLCQQPRAGGLPVCSRDPRHRQRLRRRAEETIRDETGALTQLWNSGDKNAEAELRRVRVRRLLIQHGARTASDSLFRELQSVRGPSLTRQEQASRNRGAAVERYITHDNVGGHGDKTRRQVGEWPGRARNTELRVHTGHGSEAARTVERIGVEGNSSGPWMGWSGATARRRNAPPTISENTGAETSPPWCLPALGSSSTTMAASLGLVAGATPPKTAKKRSVE